MVVLMPRMRHRLAFFLKKLFRMCLLLLCVSAVAFALMSVSPLDAVKVNVGQAALGSMSAEQIANLEDYWGTGTPPAERYFKWLSGFIRGDMGVSLLYRQPVAKVIAVRFWNSIWLIASAWLLSGILGAVLGVAAGVYRGCLFDRLVRLYCLIVSSTPAFWLAILLLMIFSVWAGALPVGFSVPPGVEAAGVSVADKFRHALLPTLVLTVVGASNIAFHTREKTVEVMDADYVLFARARGEGMFSIAVRHCLRNVALPAITLQFASVSEIFGGSVLVEQVFSYPGLGQAAVAAGLRGDMPLLMGVTVISSALVFGGNLIADVLYGAVDPRIRRSVSGR